MLMQHYFGLVRKAVVVEVRVEEAVLQHCYDWNRFHSDWFSEETSKNILTTFCLQPEFLMVVVEEDD